jgi:type III pantothenate kinase
MWLIDVSNTFTKCSLFAKHRHTQRLRIPTANITAATLRHIYSQYKRPQTIIVSSVVPKVTQIIKKTFPQSQILSGTNPLPINLRYPKPSEIGADRIANAIALHAMGKFPAIAVDFGTAITLDILDSTGAYIGGVIAPGWQSMLAYLHEKTALLPLAKIQGTPPPIGKNTLQAIRAGIHYGFIGLVQNIIRSSCGHLPVPPRLIVATGGDSSWICKNLPEIQENIPNLTLDGLRLYAEFLAQKDPKMTQNCNTKTPPKTQFALGKNQHHG